jgi:serine/threonine-protein kinase
VSAPQIIGRYVLFDKIASGGMATVHFGRLSGPAGFSRAVAIKRMHPQLAEDREFVAMFTDEANLTARIRHLNVVPTLDVVSGDGELLIVMEYVQGESLARLLAAMSARGARVALPIVAAILSGALHGLHAAHEATSRQGAPLGIVHRDVSPQNILVGIDGVARVLDFGVAKALGRIQSTRDGQLKGKLSYMAPEQVRGQAVTRQADVFAAAVVLWEALTSQRLFRHENDAALIQQVLFAPIHPPSAFYEDIPAALDAIVMCGLARDPHARFATALEMATALEAAVPLANPSQVGSWVRAVARDAVTAQVAMLTRIESAPSVRNPSWSQQPLQGPPRAASAPAATWPAPVDTSVDTRAELASRTGAGSTGPSATGLFAVVAATVLTLGAAGAGLWLLRSARAAKPPAAVTQSIGRFDVRVAGVGGSVTAEDVASRLRPISCSWTWAYKQELRARRGRGQPPIDGKGEVHLEVGSGDPKVTLKGMETWEAYGVVLRAGMFGVGQEIHGAGWADLEIILESQPLACSDADSNPAVDVSFARDIRPLLNRNDSAHPGGCVSCHSGGQPGRAIDEFDITHLGALRGAVIPTGHGHMIVPGKPCDSVLVQSLRGDDLDGWCRMPEDGPPYWSDAEIQRVMDWIAEGAKGGDEE